MRARADVRLEVSGSVREVEGELEVQTDVSNRGESPTGPLTAEAELLGERAHGALAGGVAPGTAGRIAFRLPVDLGKPGVYPLTLLLDFSPPAGAPQSQRAFLLLALGGQAEPPVRLTVEPLRLGSHGEVRVAIESGDAAPHRVRLRLETPRGLRALGGAREVDVPAAGRVAAGLGLLRAGAPRDSRQGVLVLAEDSGGPLHRTTVATGTVEVLGEAPWLPRLRGPLAALAAVLVAITLLAELRRRRRTP